MELFMSRRIAGLTIDPRRFAARVVFAALCALLLTVVALPLGRSMAQAAPEIQIVNPELKQQNLKLNYRAGYFAKTGTPETPAKRKSSGQ